MHPNQPPNNRRLRVIYAVIAVLYGLIVFALGTAWYSGQMLEPFHFFNDLPEWKQLDKFAHLFWTFQVCALASRMFAWAGAEKPNTLGSVTGFFIVSSIEIFDGFSIGYGASVYDLVANGLGATLFFVQTKFWNRIHLFAKFSFHSSAFATLRPDLLGGTFLEQMLKDYNGQTFWYSWKPPLKWWPDWLAVAIGVGAQGMVRGRDFQSEELGFHPYRKFLLSLDLNPNALESKTKWKNWVIYPLRIFKFPFPTIELSERGIVFHWIYF
jgi:hypothetical protein